MGGQVTAVLFKSGTLLVAARRGCGVEDVVAIATALTSEYHSDMDVAIRAAWCPEEA